MKISYSSFIIFTSLVSSSLVFSQELVEWNYQKRPDQKVEETPNWNPPETRPNNNTNPPTVFEDKEVTGKRFDFNRSDSLKIYEPTSSDYKYFTHHQVKEMDLSLSIEEYYAKNYLQKDYFEVLLPANMGQAVNPLTYQKADNIIGNNVPAGKYYEYISAEDIKYFDVKTPTTFFDYESGIEEGHILKSYFTHNLNKQFNYAFGYNGMRSKGKYLRELSIHNDFWSSVNFKTNNDRYKAWAHFIHQNLDSEENGGIQDRSQFEQGDDNFSSRDQISVNLQNSESRQDIRRFYLGHQYKLAPNEKREGIDLYLKHDISYETKQYSYLETQTESYYPSALISDLESSENNLGNKLKEFNTSVLLGYSRENLNVELGGNYIQADYESGINGEILNNLENSFSSVVGHLNYKRNEDLEIKANGTYRTSGGLYMLDASADYNINSDYQLTVGAKTQSTLPSYASTLFRSFYQDYNYSNELKNQKYNSFYAALYLPEYKTKISGNLSSVKNHVYYQNDNTPSQYTDNINISSLRVENHFEYQKFHLNTQLLYQNISNSEILPLPEFIARATIYYQDKIFEQAAELQTGINLYYASKSNLREFSPIINEYKLQDPETIYSTGGGLPTIDMFMNLRVKRMRIYLKSENMNSIFDKTPSYYTSPNRPLNDWRFRIGILWHMFT